MVSAADLMQNGVHLHLVVALDVLETVGPGIRRRYGALVGQRIAAGRAHVHAGQADRNRINLRRIVVVHVGAVPGTVH